MSILMLLVFALGYLLIALEHPLKIDKAASAILTGVLCWTILILGQDAIFAHAAPALTESEEGPIFSNTPCYSMSERSPKSFSFCSGP